MKSLSSPLACAGLVIAGLWFPPDVTACSCVSIPDANTEAARARVQRSFDAASAVFAGEVVYADRFLARIRVERVWKGDVGAEVSMRHATVTPDGLVSESTCDYRFTQGKKYLVFATADSPKVMNADRCGPTALLESAAETITLLRRSVGRKR